MINVIMLRVIMLNVIMLNVIMQNVIILIAMAPVLPKVILSTFIQHDIRKMLILRLQIWPLHI
jgi:hypothetical protein